MTTIGLLNPGAMGASVGAAAAGNRHRVLWAGQGRSAATRTRAKQAGLEDCSTLEKLAQSDIILSVCPPHSAEEVADAVLRAGFRGLFLDGNAISPDRMRGIATRLEAAGVDVVDGGIIGGPAWQTGSGTVLHLAGKSSATIADLFAGSPLSTNVVSANIGDASALKMVFAAYTKGTTALLSAILAVAEKENVRDQLEKQWGDKFTSDTHRRVTTNTAKAWRFAGEMAEIAATFKSAGQSDGFHQAAAETFSRLACFKDASTPTIDDVLAELQAPDLSLQHRP